MARILAALLFLASLPGPLLADVRPTVALVRSSSIGPFVEAEQAVARALSATPLAPEVLTFDLAGNPGRGREVMRRVRDSGAAVIVSIGSLATAAALAERVSIPIVFTMVLYPGESGFLAPTGVTGASLDLPNELVFARLRTLLPSARTVGVLHSSEETGAVVADAARAASRHGFTLVAETVASPAEAMHAIVPLLDRVDVLWTVADTRALAPQVLARMLLESFRHRVPMIGLSAAHVRAGALAAFGADHAAVYARTADLVLRVLSGTPASSLPVRSPDRVEVAWSRRTAAQLGLDLDTAALAGAEEVE